MGRLRFSVLTIKLRNLQVLLIFAPILCDNTNLKSDDILILLRSDRNYIFSRQIQNDLERAGIPAASGMEMDPLDNNGGRGFSRIF